MQKFGLDSWQSKTQSLLELELFQEQATALGAAGRKLRLSIQGFEKAKSEGFPKRNRVALINEIAESFYGLLLQREFIGFIEDNLEWIRKYYPVPDEVMSILGAKK